MDTPSWVQRLRAARTIDEVADVVRGYVESRPRDQLGLLPPECAPPTSYSPRDIADCAYRMAAYHGHDDRYVRIVQQMGPFLSQAAARLAEMQADEDGPEPAGAAR